eukprot:GFYU01016821.1.p1 GENE.GFYU01016821.1~~GFYU01016821.1.p1  ORF type:complete len:282 (-),score=42.53 GFYU01016821.1:171-932(-)
MFDVGLAQVALVVFVGAAVIGPRDMPRLARMVGGKAARAVKTFKATRETMASVASKAELSQVQKELHEGLMQINHIKEELQSGVRLTTNPTAFVNSVVEDSRKKTMRSQGGGLHDVEGLTAYADASHTVQAHHGLRASSDAVATPARTWTPAVPSGQGAASANTPSMDTPTTSAPTHTHGKPAAVGTPGEMVKLRPDLVLPEVKVARPLATESLPSGADYVIESIRQRRISVKTNELLAKMQQQGVANPQDVL